MYLYNIYNFTVNSDVALPCDPMDKSVSKHEADINIKRSKIENIIELKDSALDFRKRGELRCYDIDDYMLIYLSKTIKLKISKNGKQILVDTSDREMDIAVTLIIGLGLSMMLLFRDAIPLHSAAIEIDGNLIGIMAESGVGKSNLLWSFLSKGANYVTDDVLPIFLEKGKVFAIPTVSLPSKLWKTDLERYGISINSIQKMFTDINKYYVHIEKEMRLTKAITLDMLVILKPYTFKNASLSEEVILEKDESSSKLIKLFENIHGNWALPKNILSELLYQISLVLKEVPVYTLKYTKEFNMIPHLMKKIEELSDLKNEYTVNSMDCKKGV